MCTAGCTAELVEVATDRRIEAIADAISRLARVRPTVVAGESAMADEAAARFGTDTAVSVTGSAGPDPQERAVGTMIVSAFYTLFNLRHSLIGGIKETQEMLDFCGEHDITADVEIIPMQQINEAYERMLKSDVKYRFSIDMNSLKGEAQ